mmetsp:Transcript_72061/g.150564  ORF Transcript_72061/g.150564 Transcript_72061/m.150564 type:complete len:121 (+) Transcript_72061:428-790(+)
MSGVAFWTLFANLILASSTSRFKCFRKTVGTCEFCIMFAACFTSSSKSAWGKLAEDPNIGNKIKRVIGVSIFANPPRQSSFLSEHLLWYSHESWHSSEIQRHFRRLWEAERLDRVRGHQS